MPDLTTPASAEPTEADWVAAGSCVAGLEVDAPTRARLRATVTLALASQRAEIVARYEAVAAEVERRHLDGLPVMVLDVVDRIREAAPK